jgi:hypothetical protein
MNNKEEAAGIAGRQGRILSLKKTGTPFLLPDKDKNTGTFCFEKTAV